MNKIKHWPNKNKIKSFYKLKRSEHVNSPVCIE